MKKIFNIAILSIGLMSCQPEPIAPTPITCNCVEYHEQYDFEPGTMLLGWQYDYTTDSIPDLCEKDNGTWIYNSNSTQRYKYICN